MELAGIGKKQKKMRLCEQVVEAKKADKSTLFIEKTSIYIYIFIYLYIYLYINMLQYINTFINSYIFIHLLYTYI